MSEELKPCPFCGSKAIVVEAVDERGHGKCFARILIVMRSMDGVQTGSMQ